MKLWKYKDYASYVKTQIAANKSKLRATWVESHSIKILVEFLCKSQNLQPEFVLCHGTRRGAEQKYFQEHFATYNHHPVVLGTEISGTAAKFPATIQWDFHDVKPEWVNATDVVYSNAFDHSCKPAECLDTWMSCVKRPGVCVLEHTPGHTTIKATDPFGASLDDYKTLIQEKYDIVKIFPSQRGTTPRRRVKGTAEENVFIVIAHR